MTPDHLMLGIGLGLGALAIGGIAWLVSSVRQDCILALRGNGACSHCGSAQLLQRDDVTGRWYCPSCYHSPNTLTTSIVCRDCGRSVAGAAIDDALYVRHTRCARCADRPAHNRPTLIKLINHATAH